LLYVLFSEQIVGIFTDDPKVIDFGSMALRYIGFGFVFYSYGMVIAQAFNGAGDTRTPTIINFFCFWIIEIPAAYLFAETLGFGPRGIFSVIAVSIVIYAAVCIVVFRRGKWKTTKI